MRSVVISSILTIVLFLGSADFAQSQFRDDLPSSLDWTGDVVKADLANHKLFGLVGFEMGHSYEMMFGSFAGQGYNQNIYTNTMHLYFNDRLTGRLDLGVAHSPFGNNLMSDNQGAQFFIRNAELNYSFSENTHLSVSYRQLPYSSYFNPFSNPYQNRFYRSHNRLSDW